MSPSISLSSAVLIVPWKIQNYNVGYFVITTLDQIRLKIFLESILFATTLRAVVSPQATRYATTLIK